MLAEISILDLLCTRPLYQEILDSALHESHILTDINTIDFYNLLGNLYTSCSLSLKTSNMLSIKPDHILLLHIVVMVSNFMVKLVMIDNRLALNLCTLKFIKQVGYIKVDIRNEVITIKACDNLECTTEGTIQLPLKVGPATQETIYHVVELNFPYDFLLI